MTEMEKFKNIIARLRAPGGCPWDRAQTHASLKATCIEEACEVVCGINILEETGNPDNLKEELGDLLLQVVMHAEIAEEEGLFTLDDVISAEADKMIRRHPHVFGNEAASDPEEALSKWEGIKQKEKAEETAEKKLEAAYLPKAFEESKLLIDKAKARKGF